MCLKCSWLIVSSFPSLARHFVQVSLTYHPELCIVCCSSSRSKSWVWWSYIFIPYDFHSCFRPNISQIWLKKVIVVPMRGLKFMNLCGKSLWVCHARTGIELVDLCIAGLLSSLPGSWLSFKVFSSLLLASTTPWMLLLPGTVGSLHFAYQLFGCYTTCLLTVLCSQVCR